MLFFARVFFFIDLAVYRHTLNSYSTSFFHTKADLFPKFNYLVKISSRSRLNDGLEGSTSRR